jgi:hypothetical protein
VLATDLVRRQVSVISRPASRGKVPIAAYGNVIPFPNCHSRRMQSSRSVRVAGTIVPRAATATEQTFQTDIAQGLCRPRISHGNNVALSATPRARVCDPAEKRPLWLPFSPWETSPSFSTTAQPRTPSPSVFLRFTDNGGLAGGGFRAPQRDDHVTNHAALQTGDFLLRKPRLS